MFSLDFIKALIRVGAWKFQYPLSGTVTPLTQAGSVLLTRNIQNDADFLCLDMTCTFQTLTAGPADSGVNNLSFKIKDGASQLSLVDDFVDLGTVATPGRVRTLGVAGDPSNALGIPGFPFLHLFRASGQIQLELRNPGTVAEDVKFTFDGYKIPRGKIDEIAGILNPMNDPMPV